MPKQHRNKRKRKPKVTNAKPKVTKKQLVNYAAELAKDIDIFASEASSDEEFEDNEKKMAQGRDSKSSAKSFTAIMEIYKKDETQAVKTVKADIMASVPEAPDEVAEKYAKRVVKAISQAFPSEHMWNLYTRWSKSTANHYQTDLISVLKSVNLTYPTLFEDEAHIMSSLRNLHYKPPLGLRDDVEEDERRPRRKTSKLFKNSLSWVASDKFKMGKTKKGREKSLEQDLSEQITMFESVVKSNHAKVGQRTGLGPQVLEQKNMFDGDVDSIIRTTTLLEYHKPHSFTNRVKRGIGDRSTAWWIIRLLFSGRKSKLVTFFSILLTETSVKRYDFFLILAGVCLIFTTLAELDDTSKKHYFSCSGIRQLRLEAEQKAELLLSPHCVLDEAIATLKHINSQYGNVGIWGLHGQKNDKERQYLLLRAYVFQTLYGFDREETQAFRSRVQKAFNYDPDNPDTQTTSKQISTNGDQPAFSTATQSEQEAWAEFAVQDRDQKLQYQELIQNSGESFFLPDPSSQSSILEAPQPPQRIIEPINIQSLSYDEEAWKSFTFKRPSQAEVDQYFSSFLQINHPDGTDTICKTSVVEAYVADPLCSMRHRRWTGEPTCKLPPHHRSSHTYVDSTEIRRKLNDNSFCVIRRCDPIMKKLEHHIGMIGGGDSLGSMLHLCQAVARHGDIDPNRSDQSSKSFQRRFHFAAAGQGGITLVGKQYFENMKKDRSVNEDMVAKAIGGISTFVWRAMENLQSGGTRMASDCNRVTESMSELCKMLNIKYQHFRAESVTVVVGIMYPNFDGCDWHFDKMNDWRTGYTKTGVFNTYLLGQDDNGRVIILHLQVILNFQRKIGEKLQPYARGVRGCVANIRHYTHLVQDNYNHLFGEHTNNIPTVFDRTHFFLSDELPFEKKVIHTNLQDGEIVQHVIRPKIGPCRVFSYSMFIEPIFLLREKLKTDQLLELALAACLSSTPYWYHHVMMKLVQRHLDPNNPWMFSDHPFIDWLRETVHTFNEDLEAQSNSEEGGKECPQKPTWQTSQDRRFSPCGGNILKLFGLSPGSSSKDLECGIQRLEGIISSLFAYTDWIDNRFLDIGEDPLNDMPLSEIMDKQEAFVKSVGNTVKCQFNLFRLGTFTTVIIGAGIVKSGPHLRHLTVPVKGCASWKHLSDSLGKPTTGETTSVDPRHHDVAMHMIATEILRPYFRDEMECMLCESMHSRISLNCCDWFIKGGMLFDLDDAGRVRYKAYGRNSRWQYMEPIRKTKLFLGPVFLEQRFKLDQQVRQYISDALDSNLMKVRDVYGNKPSRLGPQLCEEAYFYYPRNGELKEGTFVRKIENGINYCRVGLDITVLPNFFSSLFERFQKRGFDFGTMILQKTKGGRVVTCYLPPHNKIDGGVAFIPLTGYFWVVVNVEDRNDDSCQYNAWHKELEDQDREKISGFMNHANWKDRNRAIYKCERGKSLLFRADRHVHGIIIPSSEFGEKRRVCILMKTEVTDPKGTTQMSRRKRKRH